VICRSCTQYLRASLKREDAKLDANRAREVLSDLHSQIDNARSETRQVKSVLAEEEESLAATLAKTEAQRAELASLQAARENLEVETESLASEKAKLETVVASLGNERAALEKEQRKVAEERAEMSANKRSIGLELKHPEAGRAALALIAEADVFVTNRKGDPYHATS
jgi:chromosome segregation ATPase